MNRLTEICDIAREYLSSALLSAAFLAALALLIAAVQL